MNIREKTAAVSTALNVLLTLLKFVMFAMTGSLAILAEAWHSFSDIATSFLVFLAVFGKRPKSECESAAEGDGAAAAGRESTGAMEKTVSVGIGLLLTAVSLALFIEFFAGEARSLRNTLPAGFVFLAFALASYLVYRFETAIGRQEGSVGLIADGMHAKADMVASLIAGFSLILHHIGVDVDRYAGGIIALFILSYALETLVNSVRSFVQKRDELLYANKASRIQASVFDRSSWITLAEVLRSEAAAVFIRRALSKRLIRAAAALAILAGLAFYSSTSWFTVGVGEQAVVERFGRPLQPESPLGPGIHWTLPWPVDRPVVFATDTVRQMNIGNEVDENAFALLWTREHGTEIPFLSGDNNFFYPYIVLHYRTSSLYDYYYRHADAEALLNATAHRTVTRLFSTRGFYQLVLTDRRSLVREIASAIQESLDRLQAGVEIVSVNIKDIHPPIRVSDSFERVIAALQEKEELVNKARGYASESLLECRGEAARVVEDARAYVADLKLRAEGDARKFVAQIPEGSEAMRVTRTRIYLEAMKQALARRDKTLIDPRAGRPEMWINFGAKGSSMELDAPQF